MSVNNNSPVTVDITSSFGHGIFDLRGTQIALRPNPMGHIIRAGTLGGSGVIFVIKSGLGVLVQMLDEVIGGLISDIRVLLFEKVVLRDGQFDIVFGILGVF